jgi:hypothetical protein
MRAPNSNLDVPVVAVIGVFVVLAVVGALLGGVLTQFLVAMIHDLFGLLEPISFLDGVKLFVVVYVLAFLLAPGSGS